MSRGRAWCFTLNNYTEAEFETVKQADCRFLICGREVGESGTPHLQGYVYFQNAVRLSSVKALLGARMHLELAKGSVEQNIAYCSKDGNHIQTGEAPMSNSEKGAKEKRRYEDAWISAQEGKLEDIDADLRVRHYHTLKRIHLDKIAERDLEDTTAQMHWYYGPAGTGKSRKAREEMPEAYLKMCNKWWDGYVDQPDVLIDDFDIAHQVLAHHLKIWADRYPFMAEIKGGSKKIRPTRIIVTSNYHPKDIWMETNSLAPILRRFHVTHFPAGLT